MRFSYWPFLFLIFLIPLFHWLWMKKATPSRVIYSLPIPKSLARGNPIKYLMIIKYVAFAFLAIALARPQSSFKQTQRTVSGVDIVVVMDVSASMNIEDLADRSRFEIAKEMIENFVKGRQNDRVGFVVFSGEPLTLAPPTLDYGLLIRSIKDAAIGVLKDGTGIGDGLALAVSHLRNSTAKSRTIVLLTDGDNNVGQVDPGTAGELAAGYGIKVYTIAIGREGRVKMPIRHKGVFGNTVTTYQWFENALNPELLKYIADVTHGKFYRVTEENALSKVFSEIDKMEKSEVKSTEKVRYDEQFDKPLTVGMVLLFVEQVLSRFWWRMVP
jgi:Ca-activated chloride channel homolog